MNEIDLIGKYAQLFKAYKLLEKMQCIYANQGLERTSLKPEEIRSLVNLGVYSPGRAGSWDDARRTQLKMHEITSQLIVLGEILPRYEGIGEEVKRAIIGVHKGLSEVLLAPSFPRIKNSNIQQGMLEIFGRPNP